MTKKLTAIILARGNSKGIKKKNIILFKKKPLIYWTIKDCKKSLFVNDVWVSTDSFEIKQYCISQGVNVIDRPKKISGHKSTSEEGWYHSILEIEKKYKLKNIIVLQATSPIRGSIDIDFAYKKFLNMKFDSLFSSVRIENYYNWKIQKNLLKPLFNRKVRPMRQKIDYNFQENGSFYIFSAIGFKRNKNRLFGKIGTYEQKKFKSFQIDNIDDLEFLENLAKNYLT